MVPNYLYGAVRIEDANRIGLEHLLRYCAPPSARVLTPNVPLRSGVMTLTLAAVPPAPTFAAIRDQSSHRAVSR